MVRRSLLPRCARLLTPARSSHAHPQFVAKSLVGENYLLYGLDTGRGQHGRDEEAEGLLDEHFHGPDSRRTSFDDRDSEA